MSVDGETLSAINGIEEACATARARADFHDVWESRDKVIEERERARQACNAYWHDLMRIALLCAQTDDEYPLKAVERTVRERDEARASVADAYRRGAEAMRLACQEWCRAWENDGEAIADALADLRVEEP